MLIKAFVYRALKCEPPISAVLFSLFILVIVLNVGITFFDVTVATFNI